jgi:folate-binding protein YgfZ
MTTLGTMQRTTVAMAEVAGQSVVEHYGDPAAEYAALHSTALLVDRSQRARMRLTGPKAAEMVTGLVTNDIMGLSPGQGLYAAALTPKGKIVADVRVFAASAGSPVVVGPSAVDALLVDVPPRAAAGWTEMVRRYINPRVAPYQDATDAVRDVGAFGPQARRIVAEATGVNAAVLATLPLFGHVTGDVDGVPVTIARVPDLEIEGYEIFAPAGARDALWVRLAGAGAVPGGLAAWEIARVEAGRPEWGLDVDESTIPQEANFDDLHAISYTKGCYVGQETVARVHFRGHVNRHLRGLRWASPELPPHRAHLVDATGKPVGDVRSTALSPRLGPIALGMVRREVAFGDTVTARWDGGELSATVVGLPF